MPEIEVGAAVLYIPSLIHQLDMDCKGDLLFEFHHTNAVGGVRAGDVADPKQCGKIQAKNKDGHYEMTSGHVLKAGKAKRPWPARVVRVNADGTCDLDIDHPFGGFTLHYPDRDAHPDAAGIRHDPKKSPHTFHCDGE